MLIFCPVSNARNSSEVKWKAGLANRSCKIVFLYEFHDYILEKSLYDFNKLDGISKGPK